MKTTGKLIRLTVLSILMVGCSKAPEPEDACNFVQNSQKQRVSWKSSVPVPLYLHKSIPLEYRSAFYDAVARWETRWGRRLFDIVGIDYRDGTASQDGRSVIYWSEEWSEDRRQEQARTTIFWRNDRITEADMKVNAKNYDYYSKEVETGTVHLESLIIHELGHVLGLKHIDKTDSVMNSVLPNYLVRDEIEEEDLKSMECEYI